MSSSITISVVENGAITVTESGDTIEVTEVSAGTVEITAVETGPAGADGSPDTAAQVLAKLVTVDGTGSGLDADMLDGLDSTAFQPVDSDLTAIAALTTTTYGRAFLALADAAAGRTALGLGTAATSASGDFQPVDSDLTAIAALTTTTFGRGLLALADAAALRTSMGLDAAVTPYTPARSWNVDLTGASQPADVKAGLDTLELYLQAIINTSHAATLAALSGDATSAFDWNGQELTGISPGNANGEAATYEQTPAGLFTTKGDTLVATAAHTAARKGAPADGKFRGGLASQSDGWVDIDLPWRDNHLAWIGYFFTNNGTPTVTQDSAALGGGVIRATTNQNDHMEWKVWLGVGTYTLSLFGTAAANAPILTCTLDGTSIGTLDYYSAGTFKNTKAEITGITVGTPGLYEFKVTAATRNASNTTGWIQQLNCFAFKRTA